MTRNNELPNHAPTRGGIWPFWAKARPNWEMIQYANVNKRPIPNSTAPPLRPARAEMDIHHGQGEFKIELRRVLRYVLAATPRFIHEASQLPIAHFLGTFYLRDHVGRARFEHCVAQGVKWRHDRGGARERPAASFYKIPGGFRRLFHATPRSPGEARFAAP